METVRTMQKKLIESQTQAAGGSGSNQAMQGTKGKGKGERRAEERSRSISFKGFPKDTKSEKIRTCIDNFLKDVTDDIETTFTFDDFEDDAGVA
eukprot:4603804-Karenia_brevis.AAC.1